MLPGLLHGCTIGNYVAYAEESCGGDFRHLYIAYSWCTQVRKLTITKLC